MIWAIIFLQNAAKLFCHFYRLCTIGTYKPDAKPRVICYSDKRIVLMLFFVWPLVILHSPACFAGDTSAQELVKAIRCENLDNVAQLLLDSPDLINQEIQTNRTALMIACEIDSLPIVKHLVDNGAEINKKSADNCTGILFASLKPLKWNIVTYLIEKGADCNQQDFHGRSASFEIASHGSMDQIKYFTDHGANWNTTTPMGDYALLMAIRNHQQIKIIEFLYQNTESDVLSGNKFDIPLLVAEKEYHRDSSYSKAIIDILIKAGEAPCKPDSNGNTLLHFAAKEGDLAACKLALENKLDVNAINRDKQSPFDWAVANGASSILSMLLKRGGKSGEQSEKGISPVTRACENAPANTETLNLLLKNGYDANSHDGIGRPVLLLCAIHDDLPAAQVLLQNGATVNCTDDMGNAPLHYFALRGDLDGCQLLVQYGADIELKNHRGKTAMLDVFSQCKSSSDVKMLFETIFSGNAPGMARTLSWLYQIHTGHWNMSILVAQIFLLLLSLFVYLRRRRSFASADQRTAKYDGLAKLFTNFDEVAILFSRRDGIRLQLWLLLPTMLAPIVLYYFDPMFQIVFGAMWRNALLVSLFGIIFLIAVDSSRIFRRRIFLDLILAGFAIVAILIFLESAYELVSIELFTLPLIQLFISVFTGILSGIALLKGIRLDISVSKRSLKSIRQCKVQAESEMDQHIESSGKWDESRNK